MSKDWALDIAVMHRKYGADAWMDESTPDLRKSLLRFRMKMLTEEYAETMSAFMDGDPEEVIDGMIDLCVIAIGTMDLMGVDVSKAWNEVLEANMSKQVGVKPTRINPLGLPDLIKPVGWNRPNHKGNYGDFSECLE